MRSNWRKMVALLGAGTIALTCGMSVAAAGLEDIFDPEYYVSAYGDLENAFGHDAKALQKHYQEYGKEEGRKTNPFFDAKYYRERYSDLDAAFGDDWDAYYEHYLEYGLKEGRSGAEDGFDAQAYLERYPDLQERIGNDPVALFEHYVKYGYAEGRDGKAEPAPAPAASVSQEPTDESFGEPIVPPVDEPADEPVVPPVDEPADEPAVPPVDEPADEPAVPPVDEPADEPAVPPVDQPADEPAVPLPDGGRVENISENSDEYWLLIYNAQDALVLEVSGGVDGGYEWCGVDFYGNEDAKFTEFYYPVSEPIDLQSIEYNANGYCTKAVTTSGDYYEIQYDESNNIQKAYLHHVSTGETEFLFDADTEYGYLE